MKVQKSSLTPIVQIIFGALILIGASRVYLRTYHQALEVTRQAEVAEQKEQNNNARGEELHSLDSDQVAEAANAVEQLSEQNLYIAEVSPVVENVAPVEYIEHIIVVEEPVFVETIDSSSDIPVTDAAEVEAEVTSVGE